MYIVYIQSQLLLLSALLVLLVCVSYFVRPETCDWDDKSGKLCHAGS